MEQLYSFRIRLTIIRLTLQKSSYDSPRRGASTMVSRLLVLVTLLLPCTAWGFLGLPFRSKSNTSFARQQQRVQQHDRQQQCLAAAAAGAPNGSDGERNIFHDYDKPIVLLGFSSAGNELVRLAESLLSQYFTASTTTEESSASAINQGIIQLSSLDDSGGLSLLETKELIGSIQNKEYRWPNIVVVDLGDPLLSAQDGKYAANIESHYQDVAASLYQEGLLSVYVNVDPESSDMSDSSRNRKEQLEKNVLLPFSDYEICIRDEGKDPTSKSQTDAWDHIEWEFARILARARLIPAVPGDQTRSSNTAHLTMGDNTFFLSLSFPEITRVEPYVEEMCQDVDAMEYRTDLLDCQDSRFDLLYGMQLLRRYCRPHVQRVPALPFSGTVLEDVMPIVYTVRTQNQVGTYPDDEAGITKMFELLELGLRGGVEVLDVESAWDAEKTKQLLDKAEERYSSQILGSHHVVGTEVSIEEAVMLFEQCALEGRAHGAKVVLSIDADEKDRMAYEAALITSQLAAEEGLPVIPNISLILGEVGQFSRVINLPFTPVTHETLPIVAAPGQMTPNEIMTTRLLTKVFQPKKYAILGHNIAYSVSPQMHGAAFAATKLAHTYVRADVEFVEDFVESDLFRSDDFGGTSVTIPHKQSIMAYIDVLSDSARAIGSVNTVIAKQEFGDNGFKRVLYGDNTDWKGIFNPLDRLLGGQVDSSSDYVLILGAGGTARAAAYVARKLGLKSVYYNRTPSKATELAETFGGRVLTSLEESSVEDGVSLGDVLRENAGSSVRVVISTLPAAANFVLPKWMLASDEKPIVFDVNYKPFNTQLLLQAEPAGCKVVRGSEMLWEQGVGQFELWTQRTAPYRVMKQVVLQNCVETGVTKEAIDVTPMEAAMTGKAFE